MRRERTSKYPLAALPAAPYLVAGGGVPNPRLFRVIVPVSDIDAAATFYGNILGDAGQRISPGRHYFGCGGAILACFDPRADGDDWDSRPNPDHVYFAVGDLEETLVRVREEAGASIDRAIETQPWRERSFYCRDPFGNKLCFVDDRTLFTAGLLLQSTSVRTCASSLPFTAETTERSSWGHPNFRAAGKAFCTFEMIHDRPSLAFRLPPGEIDELSASGQGFATPYGRGRWASLWVDGQVDWSKVKSLVELSYRAVANKRMLRVLDPRTGSNRRRDSERSDTPRSAVRVENPSRRRSV